ncbi:MAG: hypothetical protein IJ887_13775 [Prevotella sp.]|nr:hypothetical protein [Prevotella sp.]
MKKNYISPKTETVKIKYKSHLMDPSATGTNMSSQGFTTPIEVGGSTTTADSRRASIWDEEEEEY